MHYLRPARPWRCGERVHLPGVRTWVMAVMNLTPDSFYAHSRLALGDEPALLQRCADALASGADILDLGAESTRPGSAPVDAAKEQQRLLPALLAVRRAFPQALLSADTRHASTAAAALTAGADIINDVTAGADPAMLPLMAASACGTVLMHTRGDFATMQTLPPLDDPLATVESGLAAIAARAREVGLAADRIVLDPGFGFGKNLDENFPVLSGLDRFHALGYPLLAGLSRKSFLRRDPHAGPDTRLHASLAAATAAVLAGAHILRVHDVAATVAAVRIADRLVTVVRRATPADVEPIAVLLAANGPAQGGALTGAFPPEQVAAWIASPYPVVIAEERGQIVGVVVSADPAAWENTPVVAAMLRAYPARGDAYLYGPVCVAPRARGRGLIAALYTELRRLLPHREAVLFIRADNAPSLRAHEKLGMRPVAEFSFNHARFLVFSDHPPTQTM